MDSMTREFRTGQDEVVLDLTDDCRLALGTWQSVCLVDLNVDSSTREVRFSFLRSA